MIEDAQCPKNLVMNQKPGIQSHDFNRNTEQGQTGDGGRWEKIKVLSLKSQYLKSAFHTILTPYPPTLYQLHTNSVPSAYMIVMLVSDWSQSFWTLRLLICSCSHSCSHSCSYSCSHSCSHSHNSFM